MSKAPSNSKNVKVQSVDTKSTGSEKNIKDEKKSGCDEIDDLFKTGKEKRKEQQERETQKVQKRRERNRKRRLEDAAFESVINGQQQLRNDDNWVDDGLGGKHNSEGYTGRVEDGVKIFKAHILSKPGAGSTPQCPFDCECCFI